VDDDIDQDPRAFPTHVRGRQRGCGARVKFSRARDPRTTRAPLHLGNLTHGGVAYAAESSLSGMNLYFVGGTMTGRKVEVIKEDDQFNPQSACKGQNSWRVTRST
jgi:hypothetical protein